MKFTKRKDGRYVAKIYLGLDENNKKKYKYLYAKTESELELLYLEARSQKRQGVDISAYESPFKTWVDEFLAIRELRLTDSEFKIEQSRIMYFVDKFGNAKLKDIDDSIVQKAILELYKNNPYTNKPSSKKTLIGYLAALSRVFKFAIGKRVTAYNPCEFVIIPDKAPKQERRALTQAEQEMIFDTPHKMQTAAMLMLLAGLRRGELTALLWDDIDFENKTISVTKSYSFKEGTIKSTKTEAGNRIVPMPERLVVYLNTVEKVSKYVCTNKDGQKMLEGTWRRQWNNYLECLDEKYGSGKPRPKKLKKDALPILDIERFTPHNLRHTYATMLYRAGIPVADAKFLLGHSDIQTTMNIYTHMDLDKQKASVGKLDQFLSTF